MSTLLDEIARAQKGGQARGIPSICSAHPWVLKAAMHQTLKVSETLRVLLVESTCNQVNQFGGYTGLTPAAFVDYLHSLAEANGFPPDRLILGGDHLGPAPWQKEPAASAMQKAAELVRAYVRAGYTKLHLDASMKLADDDPARPLDLELSARRTALLARAAEEAASLANVPKPSHLNLRYWRRQVLRYVIGSEVPIPGGASVHENSVSVTKVEAARRTLEATQTAFLGEGLGSAWERVIALVVQPGVEFGDDFVLDYNPAAAHPLAQFAETIPFVYEAHSTDYQTRPALRQLVQDHFAILKVGPALTFAFREAVFALAMLENELVSPDERSRLVGILDEVMLREPAYWTDHYHGTPAQMAFARKYSLSDRIRYYWSDPQVQSALARLFQNLAGKPLPPTLVSQFFPAGWEKIRSGRIVNSPDALILERVGSVLEDYAFACG
jgi:D-tagatose-1,6-bisphosphate aldolase subunit GatZ/KbaZ